MEQAILQLLGQVANQVNQLPKNNTTIYSSPKPKVGLDKLPKFNGLTGVSATTWALYMLQLLDASNWDGDGKRTAIVLSLDDRPRNLADKEIRLNPKITYGKIILKIIEHFDNEEQKQCDVKPTTCDKATNQHAISSELLTKPPNLSWRHP